MDFIQAVKAMKEGKKVMRPNYARRLYSELDDGTHYCWEDYEATDWGIYEEPKPFVLADEIYDFLEIDDWLDNLDEGRYAAQKLKVWVRKERIKQFLKEVEKDMNQINITISASGFYNEVKEIINKRAGDL